MKWGKQVYTSVVYRSYRIKARKKGYKAEVVYSGMYNVFYFVVEKDDRTFNSCQKDMKYKTEEECKAACEKWIDEH